MIVTASTATTKDGYMDDCSPTRLIISGEEDWREVHALRAGCDAILVGASTLRKDNPSLVIRDPKLRAAREAAGKSADITKVVVSGSGSLAPSMRFFTEGRGRKIVITRTDADPETVGRYREYAEVLALPVITAVAIIERLADAGIERLMVEGGAKILKMFLDEDMVDRLRLAVAPLELRITNYELRVGEGRTDGTTEAPALPYFGNLPFENRAVKRVHKAGDMDVTDYIIHSKADRRDLALLQRTIDISMLCTPVMTAYSVGCVIVAADGRTFEGYTHESGPHNHAEEEAILKAETAGADLAGATIYTSMEPCSTRRSKPVSCSELILRHKMERVIYAFAEPDHFVNCTSTSMLRNAGIEVVAPEGFAEQVVAINSHLIN